MSVTIFSAVHIPQVWMAIVKVNEVTLETSIHPHIRHYGRNVTVEQY